MTFYLIFIFKNLVNSKNYINFAPANVVGLRQLIVKHTQILEI